MKIDFIRLAVFAALSLTSAVVFQSGCFAQMGDFGPEPSKYIYPTDESEETEDSSDKANIPFEEPQTARYYFSLGQMQQSKGKHEKAIDSFMDALQLKGRETKDTKTSITRFQLFESIAQSKAALNQLQNAIYDIDAACRQKEASNKDRFRIKFWLAEELHKNDEEIKALEQYREAFIFASDEKDKIKIEKAVLQLSLSPELKKIAKEKFTPKPSSGDSTRVEDLLNTFEEDGVHKTAWTSWHKKIAEAINSKYTSLVKQVNFKQQNLCAKVAYTVTNSRRISNLRLYQKSGNKMFDMLALAIIRSMEGHPVFQFPAGSKSESVNKTATFLWNYSTKKGKNYDPKIFLDGESDNLHGFDLGDRETIKQVPINKEPK